MDYDLLLEKSQIAIYKLSIGQQFLLKELFYGVEWENIPKGNRSSFGRLFKNKVLSGKIEQVRYLCKADNNSAIYIKTDKRG